VNGLPSPDERRAMVRQLLADGQTRTKREVATALGFTLGDARTALHELRLLGQVDHVPAPAGSHYPIAGWASTNTPTPRA
jgi:predicted transcriptional regulator